MQVTVGAWTLTEEMKQMTREANSVMKVEGIPFRDKTRVHRVQTYNKEG